MDLHDKYVIGGVQNENGGGQFHGVIDEVSFYAMTLGAEDVASLTASQGGISGGDTSIRASYLFAGNADDSTGTNHGVVTGATLTDDRFGNPNGAYAFDGPFHSCPRRTATTVSPRTPHTTTMELLVYSPVDSAAEAGTARRR